MGSAWRSSSTTSAARVASISRRTDAAGLAQRVCPLSNGKCGTRPRKVYLERKAKHARHCMASGEDLRRIALSLAGVTEAPHFDRLAFRAARIFTTLAGDRQSANIRFTPEEQGFKCLLAPEAFTPLQCGGGAAG